MREQYVLGIDIGGTTTKLAMVRAADDTHEILGQTAIETQPADSAPNFVARIAEAARLLIAAAPQTPVGVGVGCPGLIDHRRGVVTLCTNIPHLTQFPLRDELSKALKLPVEMQNDANSSAVGEFLFGEGKGTSNIIVLMLGTGVGGGIVCDGHLLSGADNAAAELGHVKVEFGADATPCACGRAGCLEAYVGLAGIQRIAKRHLLHAGDKPTALKNGSAGSVGGDGSGGGTGDDLSTKQIADAARCDDEIAKAVLHEVGAWLGRGMANLIETFNPEKIILAGGASAALDMLLPGINESLDRYCCFPMTRQRCAITRSAIPDTVPFLGPAAVFLIAHHNRT